MALPQRPRVLLRAPEVLRPNEEVGILVRLVARRPLKIGEVTVTLVERRRLRAPAGGVEPGRSEEERAAAVLRAPGRLAPGTTDLEGALRVGAAWPSYQGTLIDVRHALQVHVDVPWWPDALRVFPVTVRSRRTAAAPGAELRGDQGRLRVALDRTVVVPGEELAGWWQVKKKRGIDRVALRLARREYAGAAVTESVVPLAVQPADAKGGRAGFRVVLPADLALSTDAGAWRVEWLLEAAADGAADWQVRIPLTVAAPPDAGTAVWHGGLLTGATRVAWRAVAARVGLTLDPDDTLVGVRGSVEVAVRAAPRGRGLALAATLRWPSLGLGLGARGAREPAQAAAFFAGSLEAARARLAALGILEIEDGGARCACAGAGSAAALEELAAAAVRLAAAMEAARANVPPPAAFGAAGVLRRWQALATRLGGGLTTGCMSVSGRTPAGPVEIETRLGPRGVPLDTIVRVRPEPPLPEGALARDNAPAGKGARAGRRRRGAANRNGRPQGAEDALTALEERYGSLTLAPEEIALRLPAPLLDPTPAAEALDALTRLCTALRAGARGPYR
jgi:hypothetical protein